MKYDDYKKQLCSISGTQPKIEYLTKQLSDIENRIAGIKDEIRNFKSKIEPYEREIREYYPVIRFPDLHHRKIAAEKLQSAKILSFKRTQAIKKRIKRIKTEIQMTRNPDSNKLTPEEVFGVPEAIKEELRLKEIKNKETARKRKEKKKAEKLRKQKEILKRYK
jgi:hypothetical protein